MVHLTSFSSYQSYSPLGFQGYKRLKNRDIWRRRLFVESEVNTRVYKYVYHHLGVRGPIDANKKVGASLIHPRCIRTSETTGLNQWTRMGTRGLRQTMNEGWLEKYGFKPSARR